MDNNATTKRKSRYKAPHINEYWMILRWPKLQPATEVHLDFKKPHNGNILLPVQLMRKSGLLLEKGVSIAIFQNRILIRNTKGGNRFYQEENKNFSLKRTGLPKETLSQPIAWVMGPGFLIGTTHEDSAVLGAGAQFLERERITRIKYDKCVDDYAQAYPLENETIIGWKDSKLFCSARDTKIAAVAGHLWDYSGFKPGDQLCISRYENCTVIEKWSEASKSPAPHSVLRAKRAAPSHYFGTKTVDIGGESLLRVIACKDKIILAKPSNQIIELCLADKHSRFPPFNYRGSGFGFDLPKYDDSNLVVYRKHTKSVNNKNVLRIPRGILERAGIPVDSAVFQARYDGVFVLTPQDSVVGDKHTPYNRMHGIGINVSRAKFPTGKTVQVLEADGCVVITPAGIQLGKMAPPAKNVKNHKEIGRYPRNDNPLEASAENLLLEATDINCWTDFEVFNNAVVVRGQFLARGAFEHFQHARITQYDNAVSIETCGEENATVTFGTKISGFKYRIINLKNSRLAHARIVRGIMADGRLVLVDPTSSLGKKCLPAQLFKLAPLSAHTAHKRTMNAVAQSSKLKKRINSRK